MLRRSRLLSHITRVCKILTFNQRWHFWGCQTVHQPQRSPSPFKLCCPIYHCAIRRIYMKSTWISLGGIPSLQKYLITVLISSFSFLQMCRIPLKSASHKQPSMTVCFSHNKIKWPTDKYFNLMNLTEAYRAVNFLITSLRISFRYYPKS